MKHWEYTGETKEFSQPTIQEQLTSAQTEADKRNSEAAAAKDLQEHRPEKTTGRAAI